MNRRGNKFMKKKIIRYFVAVVLILFFNFTKAGIPGQARDSAQTDSTATAKQVLQSTDTSARVVRVDSSLMTSQTGPKSYCSVMNEVLLENRFINVKGEPLYFAIQQKHFNGDEFLFYLLCVVVLILGVFKTFYQGYFKNVFRVFFNTSLRQSQLTDQLLQSKLPSFILNIFFAISAGIFCWLLVRRYDLRISISRPWLLPLCIGGIAVLYFIKYISLKFIGWVTNMRETIDSYIFIIFLINKITGIVLVPFIIILAFSMPLLVSYFTTISLLLVFLFFFSRYVKTYGVLQTKLPMNPFHFLIYIIGGEIIPLLLLYKITTDYFI
ncbi:MAG: DUF4271 domain-containing protein [Ginsengibacter sp.]